MTVDERILVATDLSPHSDRALDRALALARERGAQLTVLYVIEQGGLHIHRAVPESELAARVKLQLAADLAGYRDHASVQIERGNPADVIERVAREGRHHIVVVGGERTDRLGHRALARTVERLLRRMDVPLLVVAERPRGPYRNVAVAVDFSRVSTLTTQLAASMFPAQRIQLVHAYQPLTYGRTEPIGDREHLIETARMEYAEWIAGGALSPETRDRLDVRIEIGPPARVLREAAERGGFDLLVVGSHDHGRLYELIVGSIAREILAELPCDSLFVRSALVHGVRLDRVAAVDGQHGAGRERRRV